MFVSRLIPVTTFKVKSKCLENKVFQIILTLTVLTKLLWLKLSLWLKALLTAHTII